MKFKVHRIKTKPKSKPWRTCLKSLRKHPVLSLILLILVGWTTYGFVFHDEGARTSPLDIFKPLKEDAFGHTNILLLGVGGKMAEGGNLSDSIMIASVNPLGPSVSFMSLPRDLFVSSDIGDRKINEVYAAARYKYGEQKGLAIAKRSIADFAGIPIHYGAVVNFKVFEDIIDGLGGIEMFVKKDIIDPFYPDNNYGYKTFVVRQGYQHFNGEKALQYVRSRKTSSDYDRAQRQQETLSAIKQKAMSLNLLTDFDALRKFYRAFVENVVTDIGVTQMIALAKIGISINYKDTINAVLNDDPTQKGGLLYTPAKEFFGGQYVLLPQDMEETQTFIKLILTHPEILLEKAQIAVLNGSKIQGEAYETAARLRRIGLHVIEIGNYDTERPIVKSFIEDLSEGKKSETLSFLSELFKAEIQPSPNPEEIDPHDLIDIQLVLGVS